MKKMIWQWLFWLAACASTVVLVIVLMNSPQDTSEIIVGVCSILVTAILGFVTYKQTATQSRIDMLDKIPYVKLIYTDHDTLKIATTQDDLTLYKNIKFISVTGCNESTILPLTVENAGNITIKRMNAYFFEGEFTKDSKWKPLSDSGRSLLMEAAFRKNKDSKEAIETLSKLEVQNQYTYSNYDITAGEKIELDVLITAGIKSLVNEYKDYLFAFEIESIYGYCYVQYIRITTYFAGYIGNEDSISAMLLRIVDQDSEIEYNKKIGKKIGKKISKKMSRTTIEK